ncbi:membrane protein [Yersinia pestis 9]|nr:membrane protein [Yersinia pestis 9]
MVNHVWGLLTHPRQELQQIKREGESIPHLYTHHVLLLAAIPVICAFIGTTQVGWRFGNGQAIKLDTLTALYSAVIFYTLILAAVALWGRSFTGWLAAMPAAPVGNVVLCSRVMLQRQCSLAGLSPFTL